MITGSRDVISICSSWVLPIGGPLRNESYDVPPATVIETFWANKKVPCDKCHGIKKVSYGGELGWIEVCSECNGTVVKDDNDMILMYKIVDSETFNFIPFPDGDVAKEVTAEMVGSWMNTKFHPHFM
jgi:hypothetical protein